MILIVEKAPPHRKSLMRELPSCNYTIHSDGERLKDTDRIPGTDWWEDKRRGGLYGGEDNTGLKLICVNDE